MVMLTARPRRIGHGRPPDHGSGGQYPERHPIMTTVALAHFTQESHSFVPGRTDLASFEGTALGIRRGQDVFTPGEGRVIDGFLEAAAAHDVELVPILAAGASSGPIVT